MFELDASIVVVMVLVLGLFWFVRNLFHRPMGTLLDERHRSTEGSLQEAQEKLKQVEEDLRRYRESIQQARSESYKQQEEQQRQALEARHRILQEGREKFEAMIEHVRQAIREQSVQTKEGLAKDAEVLSSAIVKRLLS